MNRSSVHHERGARELIPTRQSLLSRLKNFDDSASWEDFFNTYWRLIYGVAIKSGLTEQEAQEVVQETIIAVSKKMPGFKYDPTLGTFKAWLMNQTRWRIQDQFRRRQRDQKWHAHGSEDAEGHDLMENVPDTEDPGLQNLWELEWQRHLLEKALQRIKTRVNARQYQVFDLYVTKQWPVEKIQKMLGVTSTQVYLAKHRITALLKEEIKQLEQTLH